MIHFACPQCHKGFQVEDKATGKKTKCPEVRCNDYGADYDTNGRPRYAPAFSRQPCYRPKV